MFGVISNQNLGLQALMPMCDAPSSSRSGLHTLPEAHVFKENKLKMAKHSGVLPRYQLNATDLSKKYNGSGIPTNFDPQMGFTQPFNKKRKAEDADLTLKEATAAQIQCRYVPASPLILTQGSSNRGRLRGEQVLVKQTHPSTNVLITSGSTAVSHSSQYSSQASSVVSKASSKQSTTQGDYAIVVGELLRSSNESYEVMAFLGRGTFGQVVKCRCSSSKRNVAIKILKNLPSYLRQGNVEIQILQTLSQQDTESHNIVRAIECFQHKNHMCFVFELLEQNLYEYLKSNKFRPLSLPEIRPIAQQVLTALSKLKSLGLIHADLKPENIMLVSSSVGALRYRVKVIDFGSACHSSKAVQNTYLQSRYYRAPEILLGLPFNEAIDMWSLGCVVAELFLGWPLYPGSSEYDQMRYIVETQGLPPPDLLQNAGKCGTFFVRGPYQCDWRLKTQEEYTLETGQQAKEARKYFFSSLDQISEVSGLPPATDDPDREFDADDRRQFVSLLSLMLKMRPSERVVPDNALLHPFITMNHLKSYPFSKRFHDSVTLMQVCHETTRRQLLNNCLYPNQFGSAQNHCPGTSVTRSSATSGLTHSNTSVASSLLGSNTGFVIPKQPPHPVSTAGTHRSLNNNTNVVVSSTQNSNNTAVAYYAAAAVAALAKRSPKTTPVCTTQKMSASHFVRPQQYRAPTSVAKVQRLHSQQQAYATLVAHPQRNCLSNKDHHAAHNLQLFAQRQREQQQQQQHHLHSNQLASLSHCNLYNTTSGECLSSMANTTNSVALLSNCVSVPHSLSLYDLVAAGGNALSLLNAAAVGAPVPSNLVRATAVSTPQQQQQQRLPSHAVSYDCLYDLQRGQMVESNNSHRLTGSSGAVIPPGVEHAEQAALVLSSYLGQEQANVARHPESCGTSYLAVPITSSVAANPSTGVLEATNLSDTLNAIVQQQQRQQQEQQNRAYRNQLAMTDAQQQLQQQQQLSHSNNRHLKSTMMAATHARSSGFVAPSKSRCPQTQIQYSGPPRRVAETNPMSNIRGHAAQLMRHTQAVQQANAIRIPSTRIPTPTYANPVQVSNPSCSSIYVSEALPMNLVTNQMPSPAEEKIKPEPHRTNALGMSESSWLCDPNTDSAESAMKLSPFRKQPGAMHSMAHSIGGCQSQSNVVMASLESKTLTTSGCSLFPVHSVSYGGGGGGGCMGNTSRVGTTSITTTNNNSHPHDGMLAVQTTRALCSGIDEKLLQLRTCEAMGMGDLKPSIVENNHASTACLRSDKKIPVGRVQPMIKQEENHFSHGRFIISPSSSSSTGVTIPMDQLPTGFDEVVQQQLQQSYHHHQQQQQQPQRIPSHYMSYNPYTIARGTSNTSPPDRHPSSMASQCVSVSASVSSSSAAFPKPTSHALPSFSTSDVQSARHLSAAHAAAAAYHNLMYFQLQQRHQQQQQQNHQRPVVQLPPNMDHVSTSQYDSHQQLQQQSSVQCTTVTDHSWPTAVPTSAPSSELDNPTAAASYYAAAAAAELELLFNNPHSVVHLRAPQTTVEQQQQQLLLQHHHHQQQLETAELLRQHHFNKLQM